MQSKTLKIGSQIVHYYEYEPSPSTQFALVFLHGWRSEGAAWLHIAKLFKEKENGGAVYALDLPGFGSSETPRTPWKLDDYVSVVAEFLRLKSLTRVCLVGHSFGGRIAIKAAAKNPSLIEKLVLVGSAGKRDDSFGKYIKGMIAKILKPFFTPWFMRGVRCKIYQMIGAEDYVSTPQLTETFVNTINEDLMNLLPNINQPTLIIWGKNDKETPLSLARTINQKIPHSKLVVFNHAGHFSFLDEPQQFTDQLITFTKS